MFTHSESRVSLLAFYVGPTALSTKNIKYNIFFKKGFSFYQVVLLQRCVSRSLLLARQSSCLFLAGDSLAILSRSEAVSLPLILSHYQSPNRRILTLIRKYCQTRIRVFPAFLWTYIACPLIRGDQVAHTSDKCCNSRVPLGFLYSMPSPHVLLFSTARVVHLLYSVVSLLLLPQVEI